MKEASVAGQEDPARWASLPAAAVLTGLGTSQTGLGEDEAARRLARYGPNELPRTRRTPWYLELGAEFTHFFALLLWAGAGLAWLAGMPELAWAIVVVILINGLFSYWQQYQAERAAEALQALLPHQVTVRRGGQEELVPARQVVPGDILLLEEGEAIPADARVISAERLRVDLSALTGESRPVPRSSRAVADEPRSFAQMSNMVFAGSVVAGGRGEAVVFATGGATEFGRIARLTQVQAERPSPLEREIAAITRIVTVLAVGLGIVFFVVGVALGGLAPEAGFLFAIGIIVAFVPEGLLPTLTLALALAVRRMAARHALVKRLSAVETLGATTVILTDKTGTLTENEMTVRVAWAGGVEYQMGGAGYEPVGAVEPLPAEQADPAALSQLLRAGALCCDAHLSPPGDSRPHWQVVGDPTEGAILVAAAKIGLTRDALAAWPRVAELPFDSVRKRMTTIQEMEGGPVACVKGAPGQVLPRCAAVRWHGQLLPLDDEMRRQAESANDGLARRGLRVLAVATRPVQAPEAHANEWQMEEVETGLTLLGLLAMEDPPRPEVPAALAACHRAGVRVVMVTGDSGLTAAAIAREIGLLRDDARVVNGEDLEGLDEGALDALLQDRSLLCARATPEHKLRLVEAFQRRGEVVAVTGDGVNDAPALKRADIGVAMGVAGTDVAREAADMVLADDNFASIVAAIEEGRAVFANIRKFVIYVFVSNVAEAAPFAAFVLFRVPLPLTIMQILAVDLGTDLLPALALGMERPEPGIMDRPPRPRTERILDWATIGRAFGWLGLIEATLGLAGYFAAFWLSGWRPGAALPADGPAYVTATTMTLAGIVAGQVGTVFACRSSHQSILQLGWASNRAVLVGVAAELALLLAVIYLPPLAAIFGTAPLGAEHWLLLSTFPLLLLLLEEGRKALVRRRQGRKPAIDAA